MVRLHHQFLDGHYSSHYVFSETSHLVFFFLLTLYFIYVAIIIFLFTISVLDMNGKTENTNEPSFEGWKSLDCVTYRLCYLSDSPFRFGHINEFIMN